MPPARPRCTGPHPRSRPLCRTRAQCAAPHPFTSSSPCALSWPSTLRPRAAAAHDKNAPASARAARRAAARESASLSRLRRATAAAHAAKTRACMGQAQMEACFVGRSAGGTGGQARAYKPKPPPRCRSRRPGTSPAQAPATASPPPPCASAPPPSRATRSAPWPAPRAPRGALRPPSSLRRASSRLRARCLVQKGSALFTTCTQGVGQNAGAYWAMQVFRERPSSPRPSPRSARTHRPTPRPPRARRLERGHAAARLLQQHAPPRAGLRGGDPAGCGARLQQQPSHAPPPPYKIVARAQVPTSGWAP